MNHPHPEPGPPAGSPRATIALVVFLGIAAFFLLSEHRAHLFGFLPYLLLLACPLMHLFHHRGHGGHRHDGTGGDRAGASGAGRGSGSRP